MKRSPDKMLQSLFVLSWTIFLVFLNCRLQGSLDWPWWEVILPPAFILSLAVVFGMLDGKKE